MRSPFPPALLLSLLALAVPGSGRAAGVELGLRGGLSSPRGDGVSLGPSVGVSAGLPLGTRYRLVLGLDQSRHGLATSSTAAIHATTGWLGLEAALDEVPIVPSIALGPAVQFAARADRDVSVWVPSAFLGLGLRATIWSGLVLGLHARYLTSDFSAEGFPSFGSFAVELGWRL